MCPDGKAREVVGVAQEARRCCRPSAVRSRGRPPSVWCRKVGYQREPCCDDLETQAGKIAARTARTPAAKVRRWSAVVGQNPATTGLRGVVVPRWSRSSRRSPTYCQRVCICPSRHRLRFALRSRQILIMLSIELVERSVRARVGGTPRCRTVRVFAEPPPDSVRGAAGPLVWCVRLAPLPLRYVGSGTGTGAAVAASIGDRRPRRGETRHPGGAAPPREHARGAGRGRP